VPLGRLGSSLGLALLQRGIVEEVKLIQVALRLLVEEQRGSTLPLKLDVKQVRIWHGQNFELNVGLLVNGRKRACGGVFIFLNLLRRHINLLLHGVIEAPVCIRDDRGCLLVRVLLLHQLEQLLEDVLRRVGREEAMLGVELWLVLLQAQVDALFLLLCGSGMISSVAVHFISVDHITAICSCVILGFLLELAVSLRSLLVLLVTPRELFMNLISRGVVALLDPRVRDNIRDR